MVHIGMPPIPLRSPRVKVSQVEPLRGISFVLSYTYAIMTVVFIILVDILDSTRQQPFRVYLNIASQSI